MPNPSADRPAGDDHFTAVAGDYARSRPDYPAELYDWLAQQAPPPGLCWDVGCGSGQASTALAARGWKVLATDLSPAQLRDAPAASGVDYCAATAEAAPLPDGSAQLITVAQAAHWFDLPAFYAEVQRVAAPGALLALWTYERPRLRPALDAPFVEVHRGLLGPHWPARRRLVDSGYAELDFPFERLAAPALEIRRDWMLEQLLGYAASWSATGRYRAATGADPIMALRKRLVPLWPEGTLEAVSWPLHVLAARVNT